MQTNDWYWIEVLLFDSNTRNHLSVGKYMEVPVV